MPSENYRHFGFTLIELLVVISIISLLSSVVLSSLSGARTNARDARRKSDLEQVRTALEMYYNDHGHYPKKGSCTDPNFIDDQSQCPASVLTNGGYMQSFPLDPKWGDNGSEEWGKDYEYHARDGGQNYILRTAFEGTLERTHDYPNGTACPTSEHETCSWWGGGRCVYVNDINTGGSNACDEYWLHFNAK